MSWKSETCRDTSTREATVVVTVSAPNVEGVFAACGGYLSSAARPWRRSRLPARRWWPLRSSAQKRSSSVSPGNGQHASSSWNRHPLPVLETTHFLFRIVLLSFSNLKKNTLNEAFPSKLRAIEKLKALTNQMLLLWKICKNLFPNLSEQLKLKLIVIGVKLVTPGGRLLKDSPVISVLNV